MVSGNVSGLPILLTQTRWFSKTESKTIWTSWSARIRYKGLPDKIIWIFRHKSKNALGYLYALCRAIASPIFSFFYFPCALNVFSLTGFLTCHLRGRIWLPVERVASVPNFIFWPVRKPVNAVNVEAGYETGLITVLFRILFSSYLTIKRLLRPSIPDNFEIVLKWTNTITFLRTRTQIGPIP